MENGVGVDFFFVRASITIDAAVSVRFIVVITEAGNALIGN